MGKRKCLFCRHWFTPSPRVKQRQKICGQPACRQQLKRRSNRCWRALHADYFQGFYPHQKEIYGTRAAYKRQYRQQHPDYVRRNAAFVQAYRIRCQRPVDSEAGAVSPTSCDLHLTIGSTSTSIRIRHVSHTSRDIFVSLCSQEVYPKATPVSPTSLDSF